VLLINLDWRLIWRSLAIRDHKKMENSGVSSDKPMSAHLKRLSREPLVHFLLIGLALFAAYSVVNQGTNQKESSTRIVLTEDDIRQLQIAFTSQWQRPPNPMEMAALIDSRIREEVLYREALALGLDKDDTIVKRRMAQKMDFLAEDLSDLREPTTQELRPWFEKNSQRFAFPSRITFRHLYFSPDRRSGNPRDAAMDALAKITDEPGDSTVATGVADPFMFQDYYGDRTQEQVAKEFGPDFARELFKLKPGSWSGPIMSGYGWHLVWIDSITPGRVPDFEEVEPDVRSAWIEEQRDQFKRRAFQAMKARYQVVLPESNTKDASTHKMSTAGVKP